MEIFIYIVALCLFLRNIIKCKEISNLNHLTRLTGITKINFHLENKAEMTLDDMKNKVSDLELFKSFIKLYQKNYSFESQEGQKRFKQFKEALIRIQKLNKSHQGIARFGITPFIDEIGQENFFLNFDEVADLENDYNQGRSEFHNSEEIPQINRNKLIKFDELADEIDSHDIIYDENNIKKADKNIHQDIIFQNFMNEDSDDDFNRDEKLLKKSLFLKNLKKKSSNSNRSLKFLSFEDYVDTEDEEIDKKKNLDNKPKIIYVTEEVLGTIETNKKQDKKQEKKDEKFIPIDEDEYDEIENKKRPDNKPAAIQVTEEVLGKLSFYNRPNYKPNKKDEKSIPIDEDEYDEIENKKRPDNKPAPIKVTEEVSGKISFNNRPNYKPNKKDKFIPIDEDEYDEIDNNKRPDHGKIQIAAEVMGVFGFNKKSDDKINKKDEKFIPIEDDDEGQYDEKIRPKNDSNNNSNYDKNLPKFNDKNMKIHIDDENKGILNYKKRPDFDLDKTAVDRKILINEKQELGVIGFTKRPSKFLNEYDLEEEENEKEFKNYKNDLHDSEYKFKAKLAISRDAWNSYQSGIVTSDVSCKKCDYANCRRTVDVLVVGKGYDINTQNEFWIIKGSYGNNWGEEGYMRVKRDDNQNNYGLSCNN